MTPSHQNDSLGFQPVWTDEVLNDEGLFRLASLDLVARLRDCFETNDLQRARELMRSYAWLSSRCLSGWRASVYDYSSCQLALTAAHLMKSSQQLHVTMQLLEVVSGLLDAGVERRRQLGEQPRAVTQVRLSLLNLLADCKWTGPLEFRDQLQTPVEMVESFFQFDSRIREYTSVVYKEMPDVAASYYTELMWTAHTLAKLSLRYYPAGLVRLIEYFDTNFGPALVTAESAYLKGAPDSDYAIFFWDFEIAKLWLAYRNRSDADAGWAMLEAMDYCHKQRDLALEAFDEVFPKELLRAGWLREWRLIRRDLLPQFEIV